MFSLHETTQRRVCRVAFVVCAVVPTLPPGRYLVRGEADLPGRTITSKAHEIQVSATSVEYRRVQQDRPALVGIALRTGGRYSQASVEGIARRIDLDPRETETVSETTLRTSLLLFLLILTLLGAEWMLRKRAGMI